MDCLIDEVWISPFWEWGDNCIKGLLLQLGLDNIKDSIIKYKGEIGNTCFLSILLIIFFVECEIWDFV